MDESQINITKAILANPEDSTLNIYGFINEDNILYQGKNVAVKLSKNCKAYKVTASY